MRVNNAAAGICLRPCYKDLNVLATLNFPIADGFLECLHKLRRPVLRPYPSCLHTYRPLTAEAGPPRVVEGALVGSGTKGKKRKWNDGGYHGLLQKATNPLNGRGPDYLAQGHNRYQGLYP